MTWYIDTDGALVDGIVPPGSTQKVVALVPHPEFGVPVPTEVLVAAGEAAAPGEVTVERQIYELPERVPAQTVADALAAVASEALGPLTEEVVAALLARAEETAPTPVETVTVVPTVTADEIVAALTATEALAVVAAEVVPLLAEALALRVATGEALPALTETVRLVPTVTLVEAVPAPVEQITAAILAQGNDVPPLADTETALVDLAAYAASQVSNTGWTNPANALGNTTGTAATLTATASGLLGTTNNTTTGTIVLDFADVNLGDLVVTSAVLNVERQSANAGVPLTQPTVNVTWGYSLNNGSTWNTLTTLTTPTQAKGIATLDITSILAGNPAPINQLRIRAVGTVTSGTGLGAGNTVSFFRCWIDAEAERAY